MCEEEKVSSQDKKSAQRKEEIQAAFRLQKSHLLEAVSYFKTQAETWCDSEAAASPGTFQASNLVPGFRNA